MVRYLIDFENVHSDGLTGIEKLSKNDSILIFYSKNANKVDIDIIKNLIKTKAEITFFEAKVGTKNALDLELAFVLGKLIEEDRQKFNNTNTKYYIVSNDLGFNNIADFVKDEIKNAEIVLIKNLNEGKSDVKRKNDIILQRVLTFESRNKEAKEIEKIIKENINKENNINAINNALCKKYSDRLYIEEIIKKIKKEFSTNIK